MSQETTDSVKSRREAYLRAVAKPAIAEGKTKMIFPFDPSNPDRIYIVSKNDITAGDGAKKDNFAGKGELANQTTCNVFQLIKDTGAVPCAFIAPVPGYGAFESHHCRMLPYEVVARREAHGSCLKRNPSWQKGHIFPRLVIEFFLKTSDRKWKEHNLPCDDPLMTIDDEGMICLHEPSKPVDRNKPFLRLAADEVFTQTNELELIAQMETMTRRVFLILEKAWQLQGRRLVDFKLEYGLSTLNNSLLLADVIDNDSWRVVDNGHYIDKQVYRDGGDLDEVERNYRLVAELTGRFRQIRGQKIVIWTGSESDNTEKIEKVLNDLSGGTVEAAKVICSMHKNPVQGIDRLNQVVQDLGSTVIIALIGMSNGAGPTLSANTTVPVITIPANCAEFPDDVWSSLRTPSNVPVMTVLSPANAVLAALEILALNSPLVYMLLRERLEQRWT